MSANQYNLQWSIKLQSHFYSHLKFGSFTGTQQKKITDSGSFASPTKSKISNLIAGMCHYTHINN